MTNKVNEFSIPTSATLTNDQAEGLIKNYSDTKRVANIGTGISCVLGVLLVAATAYNVYDYLSGSED